LKEELLPEEFENFSEAYYINRIGNFEGRIHLIRRNATLVDDIENKLLLIRKLRKQPASDDKILCGINALVAIAMAQAGRFLDRPDLEKNAAVLVKNILNKFWNGKTLMHSLYRNKFQELNFLFDAAAVLTAVTMLYENDKSWGDLMSDFVLYTESFKVRGKWIESVAPDFQTVYASWSDHPMPSSVSLAEMGLIRAGILTGKEVPVYKFREPFISDFYNITVMMSCGLFHVIETSKPVSWRVLPVNSITTRGINETDCFQGSCRPLGFEFISR
jgi:uncharacterized protein